MVSIVLVEVVHLRHNGAVFHLAFCKNNFVCLQCRQYGCTNTRMDRLSVLSLHTCPICGFCDLVYLWYSLTICRKSFLLNVFAFSYDDHELPVMFSGPELVQIELMRTMGVICRHPLQREFVVSIRLHSAHQFCVLLALLQKNRKKNSFVFFSYAQSPQIIIALS